VIEQQRQQSSKRELISKMLLTVLGRIATAAGLQSLRLWKWACRQAEWR